MGMKILLAPAVIALTLAGAVPAQAADLPAPARAEIEGLLTSLGGSECQFYRNGSWHPGREAEEHLRMKYEYLLKKGLVHDTDEFIAGAATKSSFSGQPYRVKCPGQAEEESALWLKEQLTQRRLKS